MPPDDEWVSRRAFLSASAAAALANTGTSLQFSNTRSEPSLVPRQISPNLFVLEDTCNVYLIRDGSSALLIDFGSGAILDHLPALGISSVDWILHTHHHRDQAQGDALAVQRKIPIAVPAHERHLFESVEDFWQTRRVFDLYYVRNDFFSLPANVPVAAVLEDYETFRWRGHQLRIQPTPGHTPGSISLVGEIDRRMVAFSGDLIHSPGKVQTLYDLQYYYGEHEGVDLAAFSLAELAKLTPALLCPSHGHEIANPPAAVEELISKLRDWHGFWYSYGFTLDNRPRVLTPHVVAHYQTMSSFYAIVSDSGKALFIDYGNPSWNSFYAFKDAIGPNGRMRFLAHSIDNLRANHGVRTVDVAIASHMHDDHVAGFPYLARHHDTKIWAFENFAHILEHPAERNLGCTLGEPLKVDRVLRDRETFRWEEFTFTAVHSPGHTDYQMALFTEIDGLRIAFTGDAFFHDSDKPFAIRHNLIYRNRVNLGDHIKSVNNLLEFKPHVIAPGHGEHFLLDPDMAREFKTRLERQDALCRSLLADRDTDVGLDPSAIEITPYQSRARPGAKQRFEVRFRNHCSQPVKLEIALLVPAGWQCDKDRAELTIPGGSSGSTAVLVTIGPETSARRHLIIADVVANGRYIGQRAEAFVTVHPAASYALA